jgi:hypothetical protein
MMTKDSNPPVYENDVPASPRVQVAGLVSDVRSLAEAEWEYAKARLSYSGGVVRKAGLFALLCILALSAAAVGLVVGILLILANIWGPWIATCVVVLLFSFVAYIFAIIARKTARNLSFAKDDGDGR